MRELPLDDGVKGRTTFMMKKTDGKVAKNVTGGRQDKGKIYVDELYFRHVDQVERWRQEYERHQLLENKLSELNNLTYEEVDYAPQLVRAIFKERPIPDFSYMIVEARSKAEEKFFMPIITHVVILIVAIIVLVSSTNSILLWGSGIGVILVVTLLFLLIQNRNSYIERVLVEKQQEIERRIAYEENKIAEEKKKHDDSEEERINIIEQLLTGEVPSVLAKIEAVLSRSSFPFYLSVEIELYNDIPSVKIWLPPKSLIPTQICTLTSSGRLNFEDKSIRVINRQYLEVSAALVVKIMSIIYCHIPTFNIGYVYGMSKEEQNVECLIAVKFDRETLIGACNTANGLAALQRAQGKFECDTSLALTPIEMNPPAEWGNVTQQLIRNVHIHISR